MPYNKKGRIKYRNVGGGLLDRQQQRFADVRTSQHKGLLDFSEPVVETPVTTTPTTPVNTGSDTTTNPVTTTPVVTDPMDVTKDDPAIQKIAKMIDSQSDYTSDTATSNPAYVAPGEQSTISPGTGTVDSGPGSGFGYDNNTNPITGLPNNEPAPLPDDDLTTQIERQLEEEAAQKAAEEARAAAEAAAIEEARIKEAEAAAAELARRKEVERQLAEQAAAERLAKENAAKAKAKEAGLSYTDGNYGFQNFTGSFDEAQEFKLDFDNTAKAKTAGVTYDQKSNTFLDKNGKAFGNSIDAQKSNTAIAAAEAAQAAAAKKKQEEEQKAALTAIAHKNQSDYEEAAYGGGSSNTVTTSSGSAVTDKHGNAVTFGSSSSSSNDSGGDSGGGGGGCVIATHGIETGGFTADEKKEAIKYCIKTFHGTWYGEAFRRGYRYSGRQVIKNGTADKYYGEFKDFVKVGKGEITDWKSRFKFAKRVIEFVFKGLTIARKEP